MIINCPVLSKDDVLRIRAFYSCMPTLAIIAPLANIGSVGDVVIVLDNERLTNELQQGLAEQGVTVLKLSKSGGVRGRREEVKLLTQ